MTTTHLDQPFRESDRVTVKPGVFAPACPHVEMSGWTGRLVDWMPSDVGVLCMVEWDPATIGRMTDDYRAWCDVEELGPELAMLLGSHLQKTPPAPLQSQCVTLGRDHGANSIVQANNLLTHP